MSEKKWVAGWGNAISTIAQNYADYTKDETFRIVVTPIIPGEKIRVHFSNVFGTEPVTINKVFAAKRVSGAEVDPKTNAQITFGGKAELTMAPGAAAVSDEIPFAFNAGEEFCVSMYFAGLTNFTTGYSMSGPYIIKYFGKGDWAEDATVSLENYGENGPFVFINTIDFLSTAETHSVCAFGDSITAMPWPDCLSQRLYNLGIRDTAIIRKAIPGGRMLRDYSYRIKKHWGLAGIKRFEEDVCQAGVDTVLVLHGINDLYHPRENNVWCTMEELPTAGEMIAGYKQYIDIAHKHGMKIYISPILPCLTLSSMPGDKETLRTKINNWIRNEADCDGVMDFESAVWDPQNHLQYNALYDSGDHLHPNLDGARCMAESIPLEFVTKSLPEEKK